MIISEFIYSWLKDIVVFFIIIKLVDLIMPKGQLKRYMNFIIGLMLISIVVSPFLKLFSVDFKLDASSIDQYNKQEAYDIDFTKEQTEKIEDLYIEKIDSEIKTVIEKESEYKVNNIDINIDKTETNFGEVIGIKIELINKDHEKKDSTIEKVNISKVEKVSEKKQENDIETKNNKFNSLKELISKELEVSMDLIIIYINN